MSDVSDLDYHAKTHAARNSSALIGCWMPKRMGETFRICERCGAEYEPKSRGQRFCSKECRLKNRS